MAKGWKLVATNGISYGVKRLTREEKLKKDRKFAKAIRNTVKMTDKNYQDILDKDYKAFNAYKNKLAEGIAKKKVKSPRLLKQAKELGLVTT